MYAKSLKNKKVIKLWRLSFLKTCNDIPKAVIVNDTVGTMIAAGHLDNNVSIGLIVGK